VPIKSPVITRCKSGQPLSTPIQEVDLPIPLACFLLDHDLLATPDTTNLVAVHFLPLFQWQEKQKLQHYPLIWLCNE
jgi:hypothetical protein